MLISTYETIFGTIYNYFFFPFTQKRVHINYISIRNVLKLSSTLRTKWYRSYLYKSNKRSHKSTPISLLQIHDNGSSYASNYY